MEIFYAVAWRAGFQGEMSSEKSFLAPAGSVALLIDTDSHPLPSFLEQQLVNLPGEVSIKCLLS